MSNTLKGLSIVRREEEGNAAEGASDSAAALDHQANAELPSNNDAADRRESRENAENLAEVGAGHGYVKK
jgi:hypothetical protein